MAAALHTTAFRLAYSECDPAGIVYYATYYLWMERTHTEWTYLRGIRSDDMARRWGASIVSRASGCLYHQPGLLFDAIRCEMRLGRLGRTSYTMRCDFVRTDDDALLCSGHLTLVFVDADGRAQPVPEEMRGELLSAGDPVGLPV